ncbi:MULTISPECIES: flagellar hook-basal body complex protein FliE [unclassified Serratia (in: enterobacteria)]|uniref:flagellar hook-basal body complex protein FliE n=1 Tax=unclassified Serratia (in: enterobacteria) TaxID=2647522 RepID=UPI000504E8D9|nr:MULTISPECIES: flagellar hook-basal body complex protein FliE [unclassified Serratia (in: enterobacteria)]KFK95361.1 flagellar hook-basal body protein FliE [Serratia sp. Ag2]KFK98709.1 flagellar hook-basal body protein FliE [Serratia sp. Ag1]
MEKISGLGISATQQQLLNRMQHAAASATNGAIAPSADFTQSPSGLVTTVTPPTSFGKVMEQAIDNVNKLQHSASERQMAIDTGQSDDLTGAMIESQKASVAFSAMVQVRNKLTTALDEVMNMAL